MKITKKPKKKQKKIVYFQCNRKIIKPKGIKAFTESNCIYRAECLNFSTFNVLEKKITAKLYCNNCPKCQRYDL